MNLAFKTEINGEPTHFPEKIMRALHQNDLCSYAGLAEMYQNNLVAKPKSYRFADHLRVEINEFDPKIHTIRADPNDRWRPGNLIHFFINSRTPNMFQFAPVVECVSIEHIRIEWEPVFHEFKTGKKFIVRRWAKVFIENAELDSSEIEKLAINDGFESIEKFFEYFNVDFEGKIIHWTKFKYETF